MSDDIIVKRKQITYNHHEKYYVPVFQKDFDKDGNLLFSPTFVYSMSDASSDQQMVASMEPDYILELYGNFKATTKPIIITETECEAFKDWKHKK